MGGLLTTDEYKYNQFTRRAPDAYGLLMPPDACRFGHLAQYPNCNDNGTIEEDEVRFNMECALCHQKHTGDETCLIISTEWVVCEACYMRDRTIFLAGHLSLYVFLLRELFNRSNLNDVFVQVVTLLPLIMVRPETRYAYRAQWEFIEWRSRGKEIHTLNLFVLSPPLSLLVACDALVLQRRDCVKNITLIQCPIVNCTALLLLLKDVTFIICEPNVFDRIIVRNYTDGGAHDALTTLFLRGELCLL